MEHRNQTIRFSEAELDLIGKVAGYYSLQPGPCIRMLALQKAREVIEKEIEKNDAA